MLLRLLRQVAAVVAKELDREHSDAVAMQPGRLFFPKHVHELGSLEPDAPDGLGLDHIRIAATRNAAAWKAANVDTAVAALASHVSRQIGCAVLIERHIVERLK